MGRLLTGGNWVAGNRRDLIALRNEQESRAHYISRGTESSMHNFFMIDKSRDEQIVDLVSRNTPTITVALLHKVLNRPNLKDTAVVSVIQTHKVDKCGRSFFHRHPYPSTLTIIMLTLQFLLQPSLGGEALLMTELTAR